MAARDAAMAELERIKQETVRELADLEKARADALAQQQVAMSEAERARRDAEEARKSQEEAERQKRELRQRLQAQLNAVLETTNSTRGLIVNMSDVLFDTAKYRLRPEAREKLAKISGLLLAQPGIRVEVEGHTDSVGGSDYNQDLSEKRAGSVRDFLVEQGIANDAISAAGFGENRPKATNDTGQGRQANRRVELVVSGDAINASASLNP
jgi:outer membrane protein OmpA-like peptidoglycan-associated protein